MSLLRLGVLAATAVTAAVTLSVTPAAADPAPKLHWELKQTSVTARLRGLSAVSASVAWASGSAGTVLRTTDGGRSWQQVGPPDAAQLQFRDIKAFSAQRAVILSIGPGESSRVYRTTDGGAHWTRGFTNDDPNAFYDCLDFFDQQHGLAMSDPVNGK